MEEKKAVCMWCHSHCRVSVYVENNRLIEIRPDEEFQHAALYKPITQACQRRRAAREWFYHPGRLNHPLKRDGAKGENKWKEVSWAQALGEIGDKLEKIVSDYGPESVGTTRGTGRTHDEYRARFINLLGGNAVGPVGICFGPVLAVSNATLGWCPYPVVRPGVTKSILFWGNRYGYPPTWRSMDIGRKNGAKLIVVDPRRTEVAEKADIWLQVRPGTDLALLLAMIHTVIKERLYDEDFVQKWCHGFESLCEHIKAYTPQWASQVTWVPETQIIEASRTYASGPSASWSGVGIDHLPNAISTLQAKYILIAICGNLDVPGGDLLPGPYYDAILEQEEEMYEEMDPHHKAKQLGSDRFRLMSWPGYDLIQASVKKCWGKTGACTIDTAVAHAPTMYRAMLTGKPYPVKALFTVASNPLLTQANATLVYEALRTLELYVVHEFFMTPSAALADYVLPAASWLERPYLYNGFGFGKFMVASEEALPPSMAGEYERKTDYDLWRSLGLRLGQEKFWPARTLEEAYDDRLTPMGMTLKQFVNEKKGFDFPKARYRKYEEKGFGTPTGKVELYSTIFEKLGYSPLPVYQEPPESPFSTPEIAKTFPLILITGGRFDPYYASEHRQISSFRGRRPDPLVQVNPATAQSLGIKEGEWVWIETPRGRVKQKCKVFDGISPKAVHAEYGWWFPEEQGEEPSLYGVWRSNINAVTDDDPDKCDPMSGGWPLRTGLCRIYRVEGQRSMD
jgi:thiosulfate reductase / polysulfide reductase chain A